VSQKCIPFVLRRTEQSPRCVAPSRRAREHLIAATPSRRAIRQRHREAASAIFPALSVPQTPEGLTPVARFRPHVRSAEGDGPQKGSGHPHERRQLEVDVEGAHSDPTRYHATDDRCVCESEPLTLLLDTRRASSCFPSPAPAKQRPTLFPWRDLIYF